MGRPTGESHELRAAPSGKGRRTEQIPCEFHTSKCSRMRVNQELGAVADAPGKLEGLELEARGERCKVREDELGAHRVAPCKLQVNRVVQNSGLGSFLQNVRVKQGQAS